ncbi:MAG: NAD-binding protein, partial [Bacteroidales bacterium]|nr:NAD-binding protein [Bacteroidales bacterium]
NVIYGDAVNEPILHKAYVEKAEIVIISVGNPIPAMSIIERVRSLNQNARLFTRAHMEQNIKQLYDLGSTQVIPEKLEIAIDIFSRILVERRKSQKEISNILSEIRSKHLGEFKSKDTINVPSLWDELSNINISTLQIANDSLVKGKAIREIKLRRTTGATLLAIRRNKEIIEHPEPDQILLVNDMVYVVGNEEQLAKARILFEV